MHGNLPALEKLFTLEPDADLLICHGDVVNYGPWSNECVQFLKSKNAVCLKGNHEDSFIEGDYLGTNQLVKTFFRFCYERFGEMDTIVEYGESIAFDDFVVQHTLANEKIFLDTPLQCLSGNFVIGHSHQQFRREIGDYYLINTGSLGQNRSFINVADYILYELEKKQILLKSFVFEIDTVIEKMISEHYPQECIDYYLLKKRA